MTTVKQSPTPSGPGRNNSGPAAAPIARRARPKRGEGQWALGYREPLNKNEQAKKDDAPLNVRDRILNIYSQRGFASIDPSDLRGRFRWMGLYTQRKPGIDGGRHEQCAQQCLPGHGLPLHCRDIALERLLVLETGTQVRPVLDA